MAKPKGGKKKGSKKKTKTKQKPVPEEITLSSDTEEEKEADEVMEVDHDEDDDHHVDQDMDEEPTEDINGEDEHKPDAVNGDAGIKTIKILSKDSSKPSEENVDEEHRNSEEMINGDGEPRDKSNSNDENKTDSENLITPPNENGGAAVKNSEEKQTENPQGFQVDIKPVVVLPIGKDIAEPPEKLKPAHIWNEEELKEQNLHLNPRYACCFTAVFFFYFPR